MGGLKRPHGRPRGNGEDARDIVGIYMVIICVFAVFVYLSCLKSFMKTFVYISIRRAHGYSTLSIVQLFLRLVTVRKRVF